MTNVQKLTELVIDSLRNRPEEWKREPNTGFVSVYPCDIIHRNEALCVSVKTPRSLEGLSYLQLDGQVGNITKGNKELYRAVVDMMNAKRKREQEAAAGKALANYTRRQARRDERPTFEVDGITFQVGYLGTVYEFRCRRVEDE